MNVQFQDVTNFGFDDMPKKSIKHGLEYLPRVGDHVVGVFPETKETYIVDAVTHHYDYNTVIIYVKGI